jgi:hypothetical protein
MLKNVLVAVAAMTLLTGVVSAARPALSANLFVEPTTTESGVFMVVVASALLAVFGAALLHALLSGDDHPLVILWTSVEKLVAAACWTAGLLHRTLLPMAASLIVFDLLAGTLGLWYWRRLRTRS